MKSYYGPYQHIWAKAGGRSLEAIKLLWLTDGRPQTVRSPENLHENLRILGMAGPTAIHIAHDETGAPVAEMIRNEVFPDPVDSDVFFIKIPIDYKGTLVLPEGAVRISADVPAKRLFEGGWGDIMPLKGFFELRTTISVPDDYIPASKPPAFSGPK